MDPRKPMTFQQWLSSQGKTLTPSSRELPGARPPGLGDDIVRQPTTNDHRINCPEGYVESPDHNRCISLYHDTVTPQSTIGPAAGCPYGTLLYNGKCIPYGQ